MAADPKELAHQTTVEGQSRSETPPSAPRRRFDKRVFIRLTAWGFAAAAAVVLVVETERSDIRPLAAARPAGDAEPRLTQAQTHEILAETRRLAAAIETLNSDRDRTFARLSNIEQGFDTITGSIQAIDAATRTVGTKADEPAQQAQIPPLAPAIAPPVTQEPTGPEPPKAERPAVAEAATPIPMAEFGVDLGARNTMPALRAMWQSIAKANAAALGDLTPIVALQEIGPKQPVHFRLIVGPLRDAAEAARLCGHLAEKIKDCATVPYDGQRLHPSPTTVASAPARRAMPIVPKSASRAVNEPQVSSQRPGR